MTSSSRLSSFSFLPLLARNSDIGQSVLFAWSLGSWAGRAESRGFVVGAGGNMAKNLYLSL